MGRYPYLTQLEKFLEDTRQYYAPTTHAQLRSTLRHLHGIAQELKSVGKIATTDPLKFSKSDVLAILDRKRADGICTGREAVYLSHLETFLKYLGNGVVGELKAKRLLRPPRANSGPLPCPSAEKVGEVVSRLQPYATVEPAALAVYGVAVFTAYAGVRQKEVRLADLGDVSADLRELLVRHPKGENRYAAPRRAIVVPIGRAHVQDYLDLRSALLRHARIADGKGQPLIPRIVGGTVGLWDKDGLLHAKSDVARRADVRFTFREFRRAWGQTLLDLGAPIEAVSRGLGHASTLTTERHYARIKVDRAFEELERVYAKPTVKNL